MAPVPNRSLLVYERRAWTEGYRAVAGVDEAGRGPLAGPVVACALLFDRAYLEAEEQGQLLGLTDSKRLSAARREHFFHLLTTSPHARIGIARVEAAVIDSINILQATHRAMREALDRLSAGPDYILVDGLPVPGFPCPSNPIVRGDAASLSVAAASVIAKVTRDQIMAELDALYPLYGFARNKGYGTAAHRLALLNSGPCPAHRRSFAPVRQLHFGL